MHQQKKRQKKHLPYSSKFKRLRERFEETTLKGQIIVRMNMMNQNSEGPKTCLP